MHGLVHFNIRNTLKVKKQQEKMESREMQNTEAGIFHGLEYRARL